MLIVIAAKLSPDAFIQMAMQLAYRRLHGKNTPTYETASTRLFMHGRTETIRTFSEDSWRWVEATVAGDADVRTFFRAIELYRTPLLTVFFLDEQEKELYALLQKAVQSHNDQTRQASTGRGFDRYFLGLRQLMRSDESHELFKDALFSQSQTFKLSTSGLSAGDRFFGTGFGAPEADGYGINCKTCLLHISQISPSLSPCPLGQ